MYLLWLFFCADDEKIFQIFLTRSIYATGNVSYLWEKKRFTDGQRVNDRVFFFSFFFKKKNIVATTVSSISSHHLYIVCSIKNIVSPFLSSCSIINNNNNV